MVNLKHIIFGQEFVYKINLSLEETISKVKYIINQKEIFDFDYNLSGELFNDSTFSLSRRMGLIIINNGGYPPVTLIGRIEIASPKESYIYLKAKPTFVFALLSISFTLIGIYSFINSLIINEPNFISLILFVVPVIVSITSYYTQQYHRKEFERALAIDNSELLQSE